MRINSNFVVLFVVATTLLACHNESKTESTVDKENPGTVVLTKEDSLVNAIEKAHHKSDFNSKELIQFDLSLMFGGRTRFNGTITMAPDGSLIKMEDSTVTMVWDGKKAFIMPDTAEDKGARFALLTWSYFFGAPYKLSDEGTNHEFLGVQPLGEEKFVANKMTFDQNTGDSPDDWYIVYKDKKSDLLAAMAYIVTFGGTNKEEAEEDPHAITYEAYAEVGGIPFATEWNFWTWNEKGELNKLLGSATISNISFIKKADISFETSANYKELTKPEV